MLEQNWDRIKKANKENQIYFISLCGAIGGVPILDINKEDISQFFRDLGPELSDKVNKCSNKENLLISMLPKLSYMPHSDSGTSNALQSKLTTTVKCMSLASCLLLGLKDMQPYSQCVKKARAFIQNGANNVPILLIGASGQASAFFPDIDNHADQSKLNDARDKLISKGFLNKSNDILIPIFSQIPFGSAGHANIEKVEFNDLFHAPVDIITGGKLPAGQKDKVVLNNPQVIDTITKWVQKHVK